MLGPRFLAFVIKELSSVLTRGYQVFPAGARVGVVVCWYPGSYPLSSRS